MAQGISQTPPEKKFRFQVALSYASEQREYVETVRTVLLREGIKVFYDQDHKVEIWGAWLIEYFEDIYSKEAEYCMVFVSKHYAEKNWPKHELRSALARQIETKGKYILPVKLPKYK